MAKNEYSQHQKAVISGYYDNLDAIMLSKIGELVAKGSQGDGKVKS